MIPLLSSFGHSSCSEYLEAAAPRSNYEGKRRLIFVSGPVGVGKTTFSCLLYHSLFSRNSVCRMSLTPFPLVSYLFFKWASILFYGVDTVKLHERVRVHPSTLFVLRAKKIPKLLRLFIEFLEILSMMLCIWLKIFLKCYGKNLIIIEEGLINMLAGYLEVLRKMFFLLQFYIIISKKLQKRFEIVIIYLDVRSKETLIKRWAARGYPAPTSMVGVDHHLKYIWLIRYSKRLVNEIFSSIPIIEIDNTDKIPQNVVKEIIQRYIE